MKWKPLLWLIMVVNLPVYAETEEREKYNNTVSAAGSPNAKHVPDMDVYLATFINGKEADTLMHFLYRSDELCASTTDLQTLGFRLNATQEIYCLNDLADVHYRYNASMQRVDIQAPLTLLDLPVTRLNEESHTAVAPTSAAGVMLNYDLYAANSGHQRDASAFTELRGFADGLGTLSHTSLLRHQLKPGYSDNSQRFVQLDTQWRLPLYQQGLTLTAGDTLTSALSWSRATRIGGITLGSDFSQRPYDVTAPLPQYFGEATLPSSVELYVNGMSQYRSDIPAGPFQLTALPGVSYTGQAQVVLTDALGRVSTVTFPVYSTNQLLRPGLNEWSVEVGKVRKEYGIKSFSYDNKIMGSATFRRGITSHLTLETHAEGNDSQFSTGVGAIWNLTGSHIINTSLATSRSGGQQSGIGYSWSGERFNFAFDTLQSNARYRDVASGFGGQPPQLTQRASVGMNLFMTTLGLNVTRLRYRQQNDYRFASLSATRTINNSVSLSMGVNQNLNDRRDRSLFANISISLRRNLNWNVSSQRQNGQTYLTSALNKSIDGENGMGWRLQGQTGKNNAALAEVNLQGTQGEIALGASRYASQSHGYASARGSLVMMGGQLLASRHIDNAFAVVSSGEWSGVPVLQDNRLIGVTDERGMLLVPRLNPWQDNQLGIDPRGLPADIQVTTTEKRVAPAGNVGTMVSFPVHRIRAATVQLVDNNAKPLPVGSTVQMPGQQTASPVGYDGMAWLEDLPAGRQTLKVILPDRSHCDVTFTYTEHHNGLPQLGPFVCQKTSL